MPPKKTSFAAAAKAAVVASESPSPPAPLQRNISTKLRRRPAPDGHRDSTVGALSGLNEGGEIEDDGARLLVEAQANSQYFRGFLQDIDVLTKALSIVHFDPAETILQEGEPGTWVGLLLSGSLEVIVGGKCLRVMQPGDFVGEMILWFGGVRQGTVRGGAEGGVVGSVLVSELHELSQIQPELTMRFLTAACRQSYASHKLQLERQKRMSIVASADSGVPLWQLPAVDFCEESKAWDLFTAALRIEHDCSDGALKELASRFHVFQAQPGQILVRRGDPVDFMMLLLHGALSINEPHVYQCVAPEVLCEGALGRGGLPERTGSLWE